MIKKIFFTILLTFAFNLSVNINSNSISFNKISAYAEDSNELQIWDPFESVNRGIFWFNERVDQNIAEPWAAYYDRTTSEATQQKVRNFFVNIKYPQYLLSDTFRLEFGDLWKHSARFVINSTMGILGIFDVAKEFGIENPSNPDMGLAFQEIGIPSGPYLVLPFLGPSNLRDTFGSVFDTLLDPLFWIVDADILTPTEEFFIPGMIKSWDFLQRRTDLLDTVQAGRESSLDFYLFAQGAYTQYREGLSKKDKTLNTVQGDDFEEDDWFDDEVEY